MDVDSEEAAGNDDGDGNDGVSSAPGSILRSRIFCVFPPEDTNGDDKPNNSAAEESQRNDDDTQAKDVANEQEEEENVEPLFSDDVSFVGTPSGLLAEVLGEEEKALELNDDDKTGGSCAKVADDANGEPPLGTMNGGFESSCGDNNVPPLEQDTSGLDSPMVVHDAKEQAQSPEGNDQEDMGGSFDRDDISFGSPAVPYFGNESKTQFDYPDVWDDDHHDESDDEDESIPTSRDVSDVEDNLEERYDYDRAENESIYDGPDGYNDVPVHNNQELYFRLFVFPNTNPYDTDDHIDDGYHDNMDDYDNDTEHGAFKSIPRIQLNKADRSVTSLRRRRIHHHLRLQHHPSAVAAAAAVSDHHRFATRERFLQLWREDVLACGTSAKSRLAPNRMPLRGFHGDVQSNRTTGEELSMSECRKVVLCFSDKALYVIPDNNDEGAPNNAEEEAAAAPSIEKGSQKKKKMRPFPSPIPPNATFDDAHWPHAVARHPIRCLHRITIGFGFQRLILHFRESSSAMATTTKAEENNNGLDDRLDGAVGENKSNDGKTTEFTYVLLTCNKLRTVSLLQQLQAQEREAKAAANNNTTVGQQSSTTADGRDNNNDVAITIDNDDKVVLDALAIAIAPTVVGVVLHYQVLRQRWRRGEREAVRRVCVVTDAKMFLLDENYAGDGSTTTADSNDDNNGGIGGNGRNCSSGDVTLSHVDSAELQQITEVLAASEDPRCITFVIKAQSRLSRAHRWRLVCRDREGAEKLVEDVRKAMAAWT